ncbi:hypothetical protein CCHR01_19837 [Colletotrichum chrysophilum]|uniref:Uncharacterized protein n=1 Tax=Colletotrichum chrysophilum TaxID=1836956 RepID=A0AAD9E6V7_9PEZI|nr:hypothetical protein CCHR01_19837 [Colletotrichum chrysophilum]
MMQAVAGWAKQKQRSLSKVALGSSRGRVRLLLRWMTGRAREAERTTGTTTAVGSGKAQKMQRRLEAISSIHLITHLDAFEASTWALAAVQAECLFASWALTKVRCATGKWALLLSPISRLPNEQGPDL